MRLTLLLCLFACTQTHAASITLALQGAVQEKGAYVVPAGESFQLKLTVRDGNDITTEVTVPGLDKLKILGQSTSQEINVQGGKTTSEKHFLYDVAAPSEGTLTLGPVVAQAGKQKVSSNKLSINVRPARPQVQRAQGKFGTDVLCELSLARSDAVIGEPVLLTLSFYFDGPIGNVAFDLPEFSHFLVKQLQEHSVPKQVEREGRQWQMVQQRALLFPVTAGAKQVPPVRVVYDVPMAQRGMYDNPFAAMFGRRYQQMETTSRPIALNVSTLPPHTKKVQSVGQFESVSFVFDETGAEVGEPMTARLRVTGACNFDQLRAPKLTLPHGVTAYESQAKFAPYAQLGPAGGVKEFTYLLQASQPGGLKIPVQEFTYFDTQARLYKTLSTEEIAVTITGVASVASVVKPVTGQPKPQRAPAPSKPAQSYPMHYALVLLAPLGYVSRRRMRRALQRLQRAYVRRRGTDTPQARALAELVALEKTQNYAGLYTWLCSHVARLRGDTRLSEQQLHQYIAGLQDSAQRQELSAFAKRTAQLAYAKGKPTQQELTDFFAQARKLAKA